MPATPNPAPGGRDIMDVLINTTSTTTDEHEDR